MANNYLQEKKGQALQKNSNLVTIAQKPLVRLKQHKSNFEFEEKMNMSITSFDGKEQVDMGNVEDGNVEEDC